MPHDITVSAICGHVRCRTSILTPSESDEDDDESDDDEDVDEEEEEDEPEREDTGEPPLHV